MLPKVTAKKRTQSPKSGPTLPAPARRKTKAATTEPVLARHRHTLLEETRNLIEERGLEAFGIRQLSARAGIGHRTIYMLFDSKEEIIAAALDEYIGEQRAKLFPPTQFESIDGMLGTLDVSAGKNRALRNYVKAIDTLYFSLPDSPGFHGVVRTSRRHKFEQWANAAGSAGMLKPWATPERVAEEQLQAESILMHDWCAGRLKEADYAFRRKMSFLMIARAVVADPHGAAIEKAIVKLAREHAALRKV